MQRITIIGRLTEDAVVKSTTRQGAKKEFVSLKVACSDERSATFYDAIMNKTAIFNYLKKGQMVAINGLFRAIMVNDKNGNMFSRLIVSIIDIQLLDGGNGPDALAITPTTGQTWKGKWPRKELDFTFEILL